MGERGFLQVTRRNVWMIAIIGLALGLLALIAQPLWAQKVQESYKDKFTIAEEAGGVAIATSSDGKYVFVAGRDGVIVSNDYGKTGTWVQTVRMK